MSDMVERGGNYSEFPNSSIMPPAGFAVTALAGLRPQAPSGLDQRPGAMADTFGKILDKVQRAAKNGERAHLDVEQVRAFIQSPLYAMLVELNAQELASSWQSQPVSRSDNSGSNIGQKEIDGPLPGTIAPLVQDAESRLALEEAARTIRQSKRSRRSQSIMPTMPARKRPQSPPTLVCHQS